MPGGVIAAVSGVGRILFFEVDHEGQHTRLSEGVEASVKNANSAHNNHHVQNYVLSSSQINWGIIF